MAQAANEYLCFGDSIYLLDDDFGPAQAEGFGEDVGVGIPRQTDSAVTRPTPGTFSNVSVFTVWQQLTLTAAVALKESEHNDGGATTRRSRQSRAESHLLNLEADARAEWRRNLDEFEQLKGREVRYGNVITLRHEGSGKFLAVSQQSSEHNRDARRVVLTEDRNEDVYVRLLPQLSRVHSEGERIRDGDPVQLESVSNAGLKLYVSRTRRTWLEVLAFTDPTPFQMQRFRAVQVESGRAALTARPPLFGGQAVRLLHVEANAYSECHACSNSFCSACDRRYNVAAANVPRPTPGGPHLSALFLPLVQVPRSFIAVHSPRKVRSR